MNLNAMRRAAGVTKYRVKRALLVSVSTVEAWESGKQKLLPHHIRRLSRLYGCSVEQIEAAEKETLLNAIAGGAK